MLSTITSDMKVSLKAGDKFKVSVLRLMMSELQNAEKQSGNPLKYTESTKVLQSYKKKLDKALSSYTAERLKNLKSEINIVKEYLPQEATEGEIQIVINQVLKTTESRDFGPLMKDVMSRLDNVNGKTVSKLLREAI